MDPLELLAFVNLALAIVEKGVPQIEVLVKKGLISAEDQQKTRDAYNRLRGAGDAAYSGSEFALSTAPAMPKLGGQSFPP